MSEDPKKIVERIKKKYKNESPENRISRWVLGTIKFQHDAAYILGSGAFQEDKSSKESFEKLSKEEERHQNRRRQEEKLQNPRFHGGLRRTTARHQKSNCKTRARSPPHRRQRRKRLPVAFR